jgi:hypothetical protein
LFWKIPHSNREILFRIVIFQLFIDFTAQWSTLQCHSLPSITVIRTKCTVSEKLCLFTQTFEEIVKFLVFSADEFRETGICLRVGCSEGVKEKTSFFYRTFCDGDYFPMMEELKRDVIAANIICLAMGCERKADVLRCFCRTHQTQEPEIDRPAMTNAEIVMAIVKQLKRSQKSERQLRARLATTWASAPTCPTGSITTDSFQAATLPPSCFTHATSRKDREPSEWP